MASSFARFRFVATTASFSTFFSLALSSPSFAEPPRDSIRSFLELAQVVVTQINEAAPDSALIDTSITQMLEQAKPVLEAFGQKHTQCAEQLARVVELYPSIDVWTAQEIRRNIEAGQALPAAEGCYSARDIIAHPAIVRTFARVGVEENQRARLLREMNEAIEHMEEISRDLDQR